MVWNPQFHRCHLLDALATGSAYAAIGNMLYDKNPDVPAHQHWRGFTNIEATIQEGIQVAYGGTPEAKYVVNLLRPACQVQLDCSMLAHLCMHQLCFADCCWLMHMT